MNAPHKQIADVIPMTKHKAQPQTVISGETGTFTVKPEGVFYAGFGKDGKPQAERRICSPLRVLGETRSDTQRNWGRLLEWNDNDNTQHRWAMPMDMLAGDGTDVTRQLLGRGVNIAAGRGKLVLEYIQSCGSITRKTCTDKTGWHGGVYVTPDINYGDGGDDYVYQGNLINAAIRQRGTLEEWQEHVAAYAVGNSRAAFAMSAAFAGALVSIANIESGGFQFTGDSKDGKTTAVLMGASIHGHPATYKRLWRNTVNALDSVAAMHNDGFLFLDELKMCSAKDASEIAYSLTNGQEKGRLKKDTALRDAKSWRLLYFSTGEISLPDHLKSANIKSFAGQEIRHADIKSDAGNGHKVMDTIHQFETLGDFFRHINTAMNNYYGTAGAKWLEQITKEKLTLENHIQGLLSQMKSELLPDNSNSQHDVVATRFALVALAGELATRYGITGWEEGEATNAAKRCFSDWLDGFGTGNREHAQILKAVQAFVERNGDKFRRMDITTPLYDIHEMMGCSHITSDDKGMEYLILESQFYRVCEGFGEKQVIPVLQAAGWLNPPEKEADKKTGKERQRNTTRTTLPGLGQKRVYILNIQEDSVHA